MADKPTKGRIVAARLTTTEMIELAESIRGALFAIDLTESSAVTAKVLNRIDSYAVKLLAALRAELPRR